MCEIERAVDAIIAEFLQVPEEKHRFVRQILLNPMMMQLAGKVKILRHIISSEGWPSFHKAGMDQLLSIRNQFAHSAGIGAIKVRLLFDEDRFAEEEGFILNDDEVLDQSILLETVTGSGDFQTLDFREALKTFDAAWERVSKELKETYQAQVRASK
jgi:hypothetical protein